MRFLRLVGSLLVLLSVLCACGRRDETAARGLQDGKKVVVTTFTILADMARAVAGDLLEVHSITKPGAEIHDYEPTPMDLVRASKADLILWNGLGLERWFERFYTRLKTVPVAVLSQGIAPMPIAAGPYSGKANPHAWMSAANALIYVRNIEAAFARLAPQHAAAFAANAKAYGEKLSQLDARLRQRVAQLPPQRRWLVTCEGAFSYLARDYGLRELYLWPVNAEREGTPQQMRAVVDGIRREKIEVLFSETTLSDKPMRQIARETGCRFGGLLHVDSLTDAQGEAPTFLQLLEVNTNTLLKALAAP